MEILMDFSKRTIGNNIGEFLIENIGFWRYVTSEIEEGKERERERERERECVRERERDMIFNFKNCLFAELK